MSEAIKIAKRVDTLSAEIVSIHERFTSISGDEILSSYTNGTIDDYNRYVTDKKQLDDITSSYSRINKEMNDAIVPTISKLIKKMDLTDAVTGELRYGPLMRSKIIATNDSINKLSDTIQTYHGMYLEFRTVYDASTSAIIFDINTVTGDITTTSDDANVMNELTAASVLAQQQQAAAAALIEEERLHAAAVASRIRRDKAKDDLYQLMKHMNNSRNEIILIELLDQLRDKSTHSDAEIAKFNKATQFAYKVLDNISSHPDNQSLRRLRFTHPQVLSQITGFTAGLKILLAVGFTPKLEVIDSLAISSGPSSSMAVSDDATVKIIDLLHIAGYDLLLEMHEPNPELNMQQWIHFYDQLKINKDIIMNNM